jgi:hypothetical protein
MQKEKIRTLLSQERTISRLDYKSTNLENALDVIMDITTTAYLNHKDRLMLIYDYARKMTIGCYDNPDVDVSECTCRDCQRFHNEIKLIGNRLMNQQHEVVPCNPKELDGCITTPFVGDSEIRESFMKNHQAIVEKIKKEPEKSTFYGGDTSALLLL